MSDAIETKERVTATFDDDQGVQIPEEGAAPWAKLLRDQHKADLKEMRQLREEVAALKGQTKVEALGPEPTLEGCNYDQAEWKTQYAEWLRKKDRAEQQDFKKKRADEEDAANWAETQRKYEARKAAMGADDFEDAEEIVRSALGDQKFAMLIEAMDRPEEMVYALGNNPARLQTLSGMRSLTKYAATLGGMEIKVKVTRSGAPSPDTPVRGSGGPSNAMEKRLQELEDKWEREGGSRAEIRALRKKMGKED